MASLLLFTLSSCFTGILWGFEPRSERDPVTGKEDTVFRYDEDTEWSLPLLFGRIVATPFMLCLDCLTAPVQALWFDDDDDDDNNYDDYDRAWKKEEEEKHR